MTHGPGSSEVVIGIVDPSEGPAVFQWHRGFAAANDHIFPRSWDDYELLAHEGRIIRAREQDGTYAGLVYFTLDEDEWEVGGLMVAVASRGKGLGSVLTRFALAHLLVEEDPLSQSENVIAYVHAENPDPLKLIQGQLGFTYLESVAIDGDKLPGLKTDENGLVHGNKYGLDVPDSLTALANWCATWDKKLSDGTRAFVELRGGATLEVWAEALSAMARQYA